MRKKATATRRRAASEAVVYSFLFVGVVYYCFLSSLLCILLPRSNQGKDLSSCGCCFKTVAAASSSAALPSGRRDRAATQQQRQQEQQPVTIYSCGSVTEDPAQLTGALVAEGGKQQQQLLEVPARCHVD
jgi:hypothetical protein